MNMTTNYITISIILVISCLILTCSAGAAAPISTIRPGNTVFIGEQGLDITAAMEGDTILGWWASGAAIHTSAPDKTIPVSNPASFSVYPTDFQTHTGNWYHMASISRDNGTAFTVADPQLDLRIEDTTVNVDVTDKWVPTDDDLQFRIDSNLVQMTQRTGVSYVPVTIKVQSPDGGTYSSLINNAGTVTSIVDYHLTSTPQYTGPIWGTSNRVTYPTGTYQIWVECNVNSMKNNYEQAGKTVSSQVSLLNQDNNPLSGNKGYVTNPTTSVITFTPMTTTLIATPTKAPAITTAPPTTILPTASPTTLTTEVTEATTLPAAVHTKSPGFESACAIAALIFGIVFFLKKD
jgi:hypothetical protein